VAVSAHLATLHRLPAIYALRECAEVGGLMSYGSDIMNGFRQVGLYTGRILKGAKPEEHATSPAEFVSYDPRRCACLAADLGATRFASRFFRGRAVRSDASSISAGES